MALLFYDISQRGYAGDYMAYDTVTTACCNIKELTFEELLAAIGTVNSSEYTYFTPDHSPILAPEDNPILLEFANLYPELFI